MRRFAPVALVGAKQLGPKFTEDLDLKYRCGSGSFFSLFPREQLFSLSSLLHCLLT